MENLKKFNVDKKNKKFYSKEGYLVLKKTFDKKTISQIQSIILENLRFHLKNKKIKKNEIHKHLINFRKLDKKKFGIFFDSLQTIGLGYNLLLDKKILKIITKIINAKHSCITFTDLSLRLDPPHDERNSLGWHQDSSYFRQSSKGKNGTVLWIPLQKTSFNMGPLEILKNSHKLGALNIKKKKITDKLNSAKRNIDEKYFKNYKNIVKRELNIGDGLITNLDLIHRSGRNQSNKFRISLIGRYHNMLMKDFNSGLNRYMYSSKKLNKEVHG